MTHEPAGTAHAQRQRRSHDRERRLRLALALNVGIVVLQVVFGVIARSLGLLADAGHNLADVAAVVGSVVALRLARRPATTSRSFGFHRATVLAAQLNAAALLVAIAVVVTEAVRRLLHPVEVEGTLVVIVALAAAVANLLAVAVLRTGHAAHAGHTGHAAHDHDDHAGHGHDDNAGHDDHAPTGEPDLNMRSVMLHLASDAAASVAVAAAGAVIALRNGWYWLDPLASILVSALIARHAWRLLLETLDVLLESTPAGFDVDALTRTITEHPGVDEVHDVHVWTLASDVRALSAHLVLSGHPTLEEANDVGAQVKAAIGRRFAITHATLELECETCRDDGAWCALDGDHQPADAGVLPSA